MGEILIFFFPVASGIQNLVANNTDSVDRKFYRVCLDNYSEHLIQISTTLL